MNTLNGSIRQVLKLVSPQYSQHTILQDAGPRKPRGSDVVIERLRYDIQII